MSMYGMMFGQNPLSEVFLMALGLTKESVGRFRDCFIADEEIAVYTRNGGGNRECWNEYEDEGERPCMNCTGCIIEHVLPKHPRYLRDRDDDFDSTYATVYFSIPDEYREAFLKLDGGAFQPDERWAKQLADLQNMSAEGVREKFPELVTTMEQIMDKLR